MDYKSARYYIGCFFSELSILENNCIDNFDRTIASISSMSPLRLKQESMKYGQGLNIIKIRKSKMTPRPISNIVQRSIPFEELSIWISDDMFSKVNSPQVMINFHTSLKGLFSSDNVLIKTFLIIGIRKDQEYDFSKIRDLIHQSYKDNKGIRGGIFLDSSYVLQGDTYIEWAYRNFPIQIKKTGLSNWNPGFDEIF